MKAEWHTRASAGGVCDHSSIIYGATCVDESHVHMWMREQGGIHG